MCGDFFKWVCGRRGGCVFKKIHVGLLRVEVFCCLSCSLYVPLLATVVVLAQTPRAERLAACVQPWPSGQGKLSACCSYGLPDGPSGVVLCYSVLNIAHPLSCGGLCEEMEDQNGVLGSVAEGPRGTGLAEASGKQEERMRVVTVVSAWPSHLLGLMQMHPFSRTAVGFGVL